MILGLRRGKAAVEEMMSRFRERITGVLFKRKGVTGKDIMTYGKTKHKGL